ncbi:MAG: hypothetical protein U1E27_01830, partial [Kiritimatiellia bacterium]|nr:hypothetical protein [Kiritimatiellia bacterium]
MSLTSYRAAPPRNHKLFNELSAFALAGSGVTSHRLRDARRAAPPRNHKLFNELSAFALAGSGVTSHRLRDARRAAP